MQSLFNAIAFAHGELLLFAICGLLIGGIDDFLIDVLFLVRQAGGRALIYTRHPRMTGATIPPSREPGDFAILVPCWKESAVIGAMLRRAVDTWARQRFRIFVGTYPNDPRTVLAVAEVAAATPDVRLVVMPHDGPTTKADNLNHIWLAMQRDEAEEGRQFKAVILHDAEDVVHGDALRLFDRMLDRFDMVQLPVRPLIDDRSRWIAGHYADEFAEAHGKLLVLREAIGAALPSAGVGCAFARPLLQRIADARDGEPFDRRSLTEDYEIGLRIREMGARSAFVTMFDATGNLICTEEHFPHTMHDAVRQKARWFAGIALAGWDRLGWSGSLIERWMRLHDRRGGVAAIVLLAAYLASLTFLLLAAGRALGFHVETGMSPGLAFALAVTTALMLWRLVWRSYWSARAYGWRQGLLAAPRTIIANIIALRAAYRAVGIYVKQLREGKVEWEKTDHRFPHSAEIAGQAR